MTSAFDTHWSGEDNHIDGELHQHSDAVGREELENTLNDMVDSAMKDMKRSLDKEESAAAAEPADAAELVRLKMKYKYKYKYKYRNDDGNTGEAMTADDMWGISAALNTADLTGGSEDVDSEEYMQMAISSSEVNAQSVTEARDAAQAELDTTWKKLAAPPKEGGFNASSTRHSMQTQRERFMPVARWLKKLVSQLDDLNQILADVQAQATQDARSHRGMTFGADMKDPAVQAEETANAQVQAALHEIGETEVNSTNLMHTTKQYDLLSSLRKRLGVLKKSMIDQEKQEKVGNYQLHAHDDEDQLHGDWNKSILITKRSKKIGSLGKQNKTFKEWRVDPWQRQQIAKAQERGN